MLEGDAVVAVATPSEPLLQALPPGAQASEVQRLLDEGGREAQEKGGSLRVQLQRPYQVVSPPGPRPAHALPCNAPSPPRACLSPSLDRLAMATDNALIPLPSSPCPHLSPSLCTAWLPRPCL